MARAWKKAGAMVGFLSLVMALLTSTCAPTPLEEEKVIKVGLNLTLTGPFASNAVPVSYGNLDATSYANDQGGISGSRVHVMWRDTGGTIHRSITSYRRFLDGGAVVMTELISSGVEALAPMCQRDQVPIVYEGGLTLPSVTRPLRWVFAGNPGMGPGFVTFTKWIKSDWTEQRLPRVGVLVMDHTTGWEVVEMAKRGDEFGIEFVGYEVTPILGVIDTSTELLRLAGKNPDWIYFYTAGAALVTTVMDAKRLGIQEQGIEFCDAITFDERMLAITGVERGEGWHLQAYNPFSTETELPGMKAVLGAAKKYRGWEPEEINSVYILGWLQGRVALEGVRLAIEKVGLDHLTGKDVRDALATMKNFDTGLIKPITMSETRPCFTQDSRFYQVRQGEYVPVSEWISPAYWMELE